MTEYDTGPVIAEFRVPVEPGDTPELLFARVQRREKTVLPATVAGYLDELAGR